MSSLLGMKRDKRGGLSRIKPQAPPPEDSVEDRTQKYINPQISSLVFARTIRSTGNRLKDNIHSSSTVSTLAFRTIVFIGSSLLDHLCKQSHLLETGGLSVEYGSSFRALSDSYISLDVSLLHVSVVLNLASQNECILICP